MDVDQLAKLKDLYDAGGLTDAEYEEAKRKILGGDQVKTRKFPPVIFASVAVIALAAGAAYVLLPSEAELSPAQSTSSASEADKQKSEDTSLSNAAPSAEQGAQANYQWAVSPAVIGLNPAFVEQRLGIPREKSPYDLNFELSGCTVSYRIEGNSIQSVMAEVSSACHPIVDGVKITQNTRFAALFEKGSLFADCLQMCGNAADPTLEIVSYGARANMNIDVVYGSDYGDIADKAMEQWVNSLLQSHSIAPDNGRELPIEAVNCLSDAPANVAATASRLTVTRIELGRELKRHCSL